MSADPPGSPTNREWSRHWITDVEVLPGNSDPNCEFSAKIFVDHELVCDLPAVDSTRPLRWSGLLACNVSPDSTFTLRLCKSRGKPRDFIFSPFTIAEVDEETGEITLGLPKAVWVITVKFLTPAIAQQLLPDELEKLNTIEGVHDSLQSDATSKYLFKHALQFASLVAKAIPESTASVSFLIYMKTWELLDQQPQLDNTTLAILRGLTRIRDINEVMSQASNSMVATAMNLSKEAIHGILALLEDVSLYVFNRHTTNDLARVLDEETGTSDTYDAEAYLARLESLQKAFHSSWLPIAAPLDAAHTANNTSLDGSEHEPETRATSTEAAKTDWYEIVDLLRPVNPSGYDLDQACLDGTREVLLNKVLTWSQNCENAETFMWISGQAGMGKTAVATSLCQRLDRVRALACSFFCQRDDPNSNNPLLLINSLICDLAMSCPAYARQVAIAIRANPKLCSAHLGLRYEHLVKRPLQRLRRISMPNTLVVVVDGLDECGDYNARGNVLQKLFEMSRLAPWLKVVVTGRPVVEIQQYFEASCLHKTTVCLQDYDASTDIRAYIESQVTQLAEKERWPSESIDQLCSMSGSVFLWASLAMKYIKRSRFPALPRLRKVLSKQMSPVTNHLDGLYKGVLETAIDEEDDMIKAAYLQCIGAILAISEREPLAAPGLQYLLLVTGQIDHVTLEQTIESLSPLLVITDGRGIRFHHPSFKDFITDAAHSGQFHIRLDQYEAELAACCLQVMQRDLCFNICKLETSHRPNSEVPDLKQRIESHIGPALKYACTHWVDHFIASPTRALGEAVKTFMEGPQLMYWIEALSLLDHTDLAISVLSKLAALKPARLDSWGVIVSWAKDAVRFIMSFYDPIATSTPHLYVSALALAPRTCLTASRMRPHFPNTITIAQGGDARWHPCMKVIIHPHGIQTLSISPDGKHIIAGYPDGSLAIWDKQTGACVAKSLVGHQDMVTCVMYSPDGSLVASSSQDATIRVWDVTTGLQHSRVLSGHSGPVHSVAFSPNNSLIASGSSDRTIRLWGTKTARPIHGPYVGHSSRVTCVAFSPDGAKLASGSWDKTIRVWSVDVGSCRLANNPLVITGHSDSVTCIAFSPDGSTIASGSMDKTIQIWDAKTGAKSESQASPAKHSDTVTSLIFSPDGRLLASCSLAGAICLWGASTLTYCEPFGHSGPVNTVAFSPDGCDLVSGSTDMTTRVWEVDACLKPMVMGSLVGHSSSVYSIAVTRDGTRIVSASDDKTVRIWDAQTGASAGHPLTGHANSVMSVSASPDGTHIVSGGNGKQLKLWNMATHANIQSYEHSSDIWSPVFSPNGAQIAFGADDKSVYLWDVNEWKIIKQGLQGHSGRVFSVAFSPDGACIASADKTMMLWDVASHSRIGRLYTGHTSEINSVAFSPCGTRLVSGSDDSTVRVWDRHTGNTIYTLTGHVGRVWAVAFSPDGSCIAAGSEDKAIRLWNVNTGQLIGQPFTEHSHYVFSVTFSPDGNYLISGSGDNTIQVRNIATSYPAVQPGTDLPDVFRWPSNPYEMTSHPEHPGWVTHDHESYDFWLPAHYEQPEKFHDPSLRARLPVWLNYSKFVHGTEWTKVKSEPTINSTR
ncbi:putative vegetative incompatibility protein HET-E-1 [Rhizoctonia solani 123E]|uniref:Putative vegetative incompatibility protein HET-E-1 n=1 Tax=Rhizoctonia solani 123E TaxID=1423351 RepID=A0A074RNC6_9AGAM|nr:putative vegetative incompatibility protein HET-E-1 [Rhizoctonia solani 123E]